MKSIPKWLNEFFFFLEMISLRNSKLESTDLDGFRGRPYYAEPLSCPWISGPQSP